MIRYGKVSHKFTVNSKLLFKISIARKLKAGTSFVLIEVFGARILKFLDEYVELTDGLDDIDLISKCGISFATGVAASSVDLLSKIFVSEAASAANATTSFLSDGSGEAPWTDYIANHIPAIEA